MIDPIILRNSPEIIAKSQQIRGADPKLLKEAIKADSTRRETIAKFEDLRSKQNSFNKKMATATKEEKQEILNEVKNLAQLVKIAGKESSDAEEKFNEAISKINNIVIDGVPAGGEDDFIVLKTHGKIPEFSFPIKDHLEIGESINGIDTKRGAKVSGARFYYLKGWGARLEFALMNMALNQALENNFEPIIPPTMVKPEVMQGTGFLGEHASEVYRIQSEEEENAMYLTGTSEVALAGLYAQEIIDVNNSVRLAGWSTCYRSEAGSYGKDTRGILRVHQFNKMEMFVYTKPENAEQEHEKLLNMQEQMLQKLELPYRVIDVAAGDLGSSAARKYDIEAWIPSQEKYRELTSTSNCTTYQSRRLGTRFRNENGKTSYVATLNGTLATTRWLVALVENHQQEDGSIKVPKALRPYLGGVEKIEAV